MTNACAELVIVPFHDGEITCFRDTLDQTIHVAIRPACEAIGLDYPSQLQRLKRQPWATVVMTTMVAADGKDREMVVVDRPTFAMWLATIESSRVKDQQTQHKIQIYQQEAAKVLDRHFFGAPSTDPAIPSVHPMIREARLLCELVERQVAHEERLAIVESKADRALAIVSGDTGFVTVKGFCNIRNIHLPRAEMAVLGKTLSRFCLEANVTVGSVPDEQYGRVNTYPVEILDRWLASRNQAALSN